MTKIEELIIAKAEELTTFHSKLDAMPLEEQKKASILILDRHRQLRFELRDLIERRNSEC